MPLKTIDNSRTQMPESDFFRQVGGCTWATIHILCGIKMLKNRKNSRVNKSPKGTQCFEVRRLTESGEVPFLELGNLSVNYSACSLSSQN